MALWSAGVVPGQVRGACVRLITAFMHGDAEACLAANGYWYLGNLCDAAGSVLLGPSLGDYCRMQSG